MSSIFFLLMLLCLCSCKYISKSDMDLGRFQTYLKGSSPYSRNIVREALYKSIRDSLQKLSDRVGEHIFGNEETRELYAYKVAKEYILSTEKENFNQDDIQNYIINAEDKIAENIDKLKTTVVEGTLKIAIEEDLLESWQKNETYQEKMRNEPYTYYLDYKTYAWMLAVNGDDFLWEENIQKFDDWSVKENKTSIQTDL